MTAGRIELAKFPYHEPVWVYLILPAGKLVTDSKYGEFPFSLVEFREYLRRMGREHLTEAGQAFLTGLRYYEEKR